jgi:solute carrier family 25 (mitochondrial uncoupling protein), member 8/9
MRMQRHGMYRMHVKHLSNKSNQQNPKPVASGPLAVAKNLFAAGSAACIAEIVSLPLDTAKVRLQLQGAGIKAGEPVKYTNIMQTVRTIAVEEGPQALWKGLAPGLLRQMVFATLRIGLYEPVRNFFHSEPGEIPIYKKIMAGLTTGTIGITIANPTDLVKIRLQAEGRLPPGVPKRYTGTINAFSTIFKTEGLAGLWRGVLPNIARNSIISCAELVTYDEVKTFVLKNELMGDHIGTHLTCGTSAGFVATVVGSPVDVTKTRLMNQKPGVDGKMPYKNAFDCIWKTLKNEGPAGFYRGFIPNFGRICSWNIVMFLSFEQLKKTLN